MLLLGHTPRLGRGLGAIFIAAGLIHAAEMALAVAYSLGRVHLLITARLWSELYYAQFLFLVIGGLVYLALCYWREGLFRYEALADFLAGVGAFIVLLTVTALLLVRRAAPLAVAFAPAAFLLTFGAGLAMGRRFGFWPPRSGSTQG